MARADAFTSTVQTPVEFYLEWNSTKKQFGFYDKASGAEVPVPLPVKAVYLDELATVKGWHKPSNSAVFSNEVRNTSKQELAVRSFKSGDIAKGFWKEIKDKVNSQGGKYHSSIYLLLEGRLVNLALHGASLHAWSEFTKNNKKALLGNYLEVKGFETGNSGGITYHTPVFSLGAEIEEAIAASAEEAYEKCQAYFEAKGAMASQREDQDEYEEALAPEPTPSSDPFAKAAVPQPAPSYSAPTPSAPFGAPVAGDDLPF